MPRTYTGHKLTDSQLKRLSAIVNNRSHQHGMALWALENKGMIKEMSYGGYEATVIGINALNAARREGW